MPRLDPGGDRAPHRSPEAGLAHAAQADRPRRGLGPGQDLRPRRTRATAPARARSSKAGYEGGQNPIHMRMRKLRGPNKKTSMPFERFRTHTAAGQPRRPRGALRRRRRGHARHAARRRPRRSAATRSRSSPGASSPRSSPSARTASAPPPARRSRRPAAQSNSSRSKRGPDAPDDPQRLRDPGDPPEAAVHGGDAGALPARRLHPGPRRRHRSPSSSWRTTSPGRTSSASSNLFSGGSLSRLSLFALGIMPYITASIILQLLTVVVPALERLQKEGEVGQQKITQYTRYLDRRARLRPVRRLRGPVPVRLLLRRRQSAGPRRRPSAPCSSS